MRAAAPRRVQSDAVLKLPAIAGSAAATSTCSTRMFDVQSTRIPSRRTATLRVRVRFVGWIRTLRPLVGICLFRARRTTAALWPRHPRRRWSGCPSWVAGPFHLLVAVNNDVSPCLCLLLANDAQQTYAGDLELQFHWVLAPNGFSRASRAARDYLYQSLAAAIVDGASRRR